MSDVLGLFLTYLLTLIRFDQLMKWYFSLFADVRPNFPHRCYDQRNVRFSLFSCRRKCQTSVRTTTWTSKFQSTFQGYICKYRHEEIVSFFSYQINQHVISYVTDTKPKSILFLLGWFWQQNVSHFPHSGFDGALYVFCGLFYILANFCNQIGRSPWIDNVINPSNAIFQCYPVLVAQGTKH